MPKSKPKLDKLPKGARPEGSIVYHIEYGDNETWHVDIRLDGKFTFSVVGKDFVDVSTGILTLPCPNDYDGQVWAETLELTEMMVAATMLRMETEDES